MQSDGVRRKNLHGVRLPSLRCPTVETNSTSLVYETPPELGRGRPEVKSDKVAETGSR